MYFSLSEVGDLWTYFTNSSRCSFHSCEHCRRLWSRKSQGICAVSAHCTRSFEGIRNTSNHRRRLSYSTKSQNELLLSHTAEIGRMLTSLIRKLKESTP